MAGRYPKDNLISKVQSIEERLRSVWGLADDNRRNTLISANYGIDLKKELGIYETLLNSWHHMSDENFNDINNALSSLLETVHDDYEDLMSHLDDQETELQEGLGSVMVTIGRNLSKVMMEMNVMKDSLNSAIRANQVHFQQLNNVVSLLSAANDNVVTLPYFIIPSTYNLMRVVNDCYLRLRQTTSAVGVGLSHKNYRYAHQTHVTDVYPTRIPISICVCNAYDAAPPDTLAQYASENKDSITDWYSVSCRVQYDWTGQTDVSNKIYQNRSKLVGDMTGVFSVVSSILSKAPEVEMETITGAGRNSELPLDDLNNALDADSRFMFEMWHGTTTAAENPHKTVEDSMNQFHSTLIMKHQTNMAMIFPMHDEEVHIGDDAITVTNRYCKDEGGLGHSSAYHGDPTFKADAFRLGYTLTWNDDITTPKSTTYSSRWTTTSDISTFVAEVPIFEQNIRVRTNGTAYSGFITNAMAERNLTMLIVSGDHNVRTLSDSRAIYVNNTLYAYRAADVPDSAWTFPAWAPKNGFTYKNHGDIVTGGGGDFYNLHPVASNPGGNITTSTIM